MRLALQIQLYLQVNVKYGKECITVRNMSWKHVYPVMNFKQCSIEILIIQKSTKYKFHHYVPVKDSFIWANHRGNSLRCFKPSSGTSCSLLVGCQRFRDPETLISYHKTTLQSKVWTVRTIKSLLGHESIPSVFYIVLSNVDRTSVTI
jgi:hypothetical protein